MLALIQQWLRDASSEGFPLTRLIAHMEWALFDRPGVDDLVAYESRLNNVLSTFDDVVICAYDLTKFGGAVIVDIIRSHPAVVIGGAYHHNPFYVPPGDLIRELELRTHAQSES
jgi:hypothetical protein